jgi:hypothetical protein
MPAHASVSTNGYVGERLARHDVSVEARLVADEVAADGLHHAKSVAPAGLRVACLHLVGRR